MAEVKQIPISLVSPHPQLATRLELKVDSLAKLMRDAVAEDVPNGQLEPGRVIPKEADEGYYVYIGVRRFHALRSLYEETRDERFAVFNAYVDSPGTSLLDLFLRVRRENEEGKGERAGLSVLEKVYGLRKIRDSIQSEGLDGELKRELAISEKLDEARITRLFNVEKAARFGYRLEHLERLCGLEDNREMFESAACIAGFALPPDRMEKAVEGRDAAYTLKWFGTVFPEYRAERKTDSGIAQGTSGQQSSGPGEETPRMSQTGSTADSKPLEIHEKDVMIFLCPACGIENMVQLRLKAEVTRLPGDPNGESITATPDVVVGCNFECYHCAREFHVFIKPLEGRRSAIETSLSSKFREPKDEVESVDLRYDFEKKEWQKIAGGKIIGVVKMRVRSRK